MFINRLRSQFRNVAPQRVPSWFDALGIVLRYRVQTVVDASGPGVVHENSPNACASNVKCATIVLLRVQPSRATPEFHPTHYRPRSGKSAIRAFVG